MKKMLYLLMIIILMIFSGCEKEKKDLEVIISYIDYNNNNIRSISKDRLYLTWKKMVETKIDRGSYKRKIKVKPLKKVGEKVFLLLDINFDIEGLSQKFSDNLILNISENREIVVWRYKNSEKILKIYVRVENI